MKRDTTQELINQLKQDDINALGLIYKENRQTFLNYASRYNIPKHELLDIYQDAILAFRHNIINGTINHLDSSVKTYLFSIGKFMILKKYKSKDHKLKLSLEKLELEPIDSTIFTALEKTNTADLLSMRRALSNLGDKCKELLTLFYYRGFDLEEIRVHLKYDNYNVVKSQKSRCLKTLRELIKKQNNDR